MSISDRINEFNALSAEIKNTDARSRLEKLFDGGAFTEIDAFVGARENGSEVIVGFGTVDGIEVYAYSQDITVSDGAMGTAQSKKIKKAYELAVKTGAPVISIFDSKGAYITEGLDILAAYSEILSLANDISGVVPQISVVLGPCTGCSAMLAESADVVVMSEDAKLYITPPSVLSDGDIGSAKVCAENATAAIVAENADSAMDKVKTLISLLPQNNLSASPVFEGDSPAGDAAKLIESAKKDLSADEVVGAIFDADSFVELYADFGKSIKTGIARINGVACGVIAAVGGKLDSKAAAKAASAVRVLDSFTVPIVTFVDTEGFENSSEFEYRGDLKAASMLAHVYSETTAPQITVICKKAYGPAFITFAGKPSAADVVIAWPTAEISALSPATATELVYNDRIMAGEDRAQLKEEYISENCSAVAAANGGFVDAVIDPSKTRDTIISTLDALFGKRVQKLPKKHSNITL